MVFGFNGKKMTPEIRDLIRNEQLGGIIFFGRNIGTPEEVLALTSELQREAKLAGHKHPLLICIDQEGGVVRRLGEGATVFPGNMLLGATHNPENSYKIGVATGKELKALGVNWNLAPVLDVNNNPENPVIGVRSFGESADLVAKMGRMVMKGMQDAGVITTLKHFPGHGDTNVDSHLDLPVISHDMDRLEEIELKPFVELIQNGADTVMTAHVYFPAIENAVGVPATLSKKVITGLLRNKLKFNGVVTTDCMEMNAISETIGTANGAIEALKAGVDLVMVSHQYDKQRETIETVLSAIESGRLDEKIIDAALDRVSKLKEKYLSWDTTPVNEIVTVPDVVGSLEHEKLVEEIYRQGVTIVKNDGSLPLPISEQHKVLVIVPDNNSKMQVEDKKYSNFALAEAIQENNIFADVVKVSNPINLEEIERIVAKTKEYESVIVGTLTISPNNSQIELIEKVYETGVRVVVIATRSPYDLSYLPNIHSYITTYEFTYPALKTAAAAIFGKTDVSGKLPVTIPLKNAKDVKK